MRATFVAGSLVLLVAARCEAFAAGRARLRAAAPASSGGEEEEDDLVEEEVNRPFEAVDSFLVDTGGRLDAVLARARRSTSRVRWGAAVAAGKVRVNGAAVRKSVRVQPGDTVDVASVEEPTLERVVPEDLPLDILYEDDEIIVVNKSPGMVTHPAPGHRTGTLVNALAHHCRHTDYLASEAALNHSDSRPGIVHRLDKGTSGTIVVAKSPEAHAHLSAAFAARTTSKTYLAVVAGVLPDHRSGEDEDGGEGGEIVIAEPIARHPVRRQEMTVDPEGKPALSRVRVLASDDRRSVVEVAIETGRTHQIRVHLAHLGTPVLGDEVYGDANENRLAMKTTLKPDRPLLHAWRLTFQHPKTGEPMEFVSPLPPDFERALRLVSGR